MAKKMGNKFVALASVAVGVVYGTGYLVTQSAPIALAGQTNSSSATSNQGAAVATSAPVQNGNTNGGNGGNGRHHHDGEGGEHGEGGEGGEDGSGTGGGSSSGTSSSGTTSSSSSSSSSSASTSSGGTGQSKSSTSSTQKYLDGTYSGSGSNQIGTVQVSVTIASGKISNVQITGCYTHYPQGYIDPVMPQAVVAQQTANVGYVSGATLSSMDFQDAVNQALQQAANPNYHGA